MKLFLVLDETRFHQPAFVDNFLRTCAHDVIGCAVVVRIPPKHSLEHYLRRNWHNLTPREMATLGFRRYFSRSSVGSVLRRHGISTFEVRDDINTPTHLDRIRRDQFDVLVSSNSLIFGEELLSIPERCCLNRHSALLPAYGGLWPVFHAYRQGERAVGVSVHKMERRIDSGPCSRKAGSR